MLTCERGRATGSASEDASSTDSPTASEGAEVLSAAQALAGRAQGVAGLHARTGSCFKPFQLNLVLSRRFG